MVRSLFLLVKAPLHISTKKDTSELVDLWNVALSCTEIIARKSALIFGAPTPFDKELLRLKTSCQQQYGEWAKRIATKSYYETLRRKRITYSNCLLLLDGLVDTKTPQYEEVMLPGSMSEVNEFLAAEIEEEDRGTSEGEGEPSSLETLLELGSAVEASLQFSVGDRVTVKAPVEATEDSVTDVRSVATRSTLTGSVVESFPGIVLVHFDGTDGTSVPPVAVPASNCTLFKERRSVAYEVNDYKTTLRLESSRETVEDDAEDESGADETVKKDKTGPSENKRARTVKEALEDGGWTLVRRKNHKCYRRKLHDGRSQSFSMSKTPSDVRAKRNALSTIRKLNAMAEEVNNADAAPTDAPGGTLCCICQQRKPEDDFSKSQLRKAQRKCKDCVRTQQSK